MTLVTDWIIVFLVLLGVGFCCVAALGLIRMPDLYNRMQSATKASTLGAACVAAAAGLHFATTSTVVEAVLIVLFFFGTAPIGSHLIGRAAYGVGVPLDQRSGRDDLSTARAEAARRRGDLPPSPEAGPIRVHPGDSGEAAAGDQPHAAKQSA